MELKGTLITATVSQQLCLLKEIVSGLKACLPFLEENETRTIY